MTDHLGSVNSNNPPVNLNFSLNQPKSTGASVADALVQGIQQNLENQALIDKKANLHDLHDSSLEHRIIAEGEAGRFTVEQQHSDLSGPLHNVIPREAVGLSSPALAPDQISSFANAVQIPQAWTEIKSEISPLHEKYLSERNPLADSVMSNKMSTLLTLVLTPPLGLAALMKHKTSQEALQQVSEKQVNFLVKAINGDEANPSGTLKQVLINTAQALDVLNSLPLDTAKQVASSDSLAAPALKLAIGLFKAVDKSDPSLTSSDKAITGTDIAAMKELLRESIALLDRPVEEIKSKINSGSGVTALKIFVGAMSDTPPYIEEKYNKLRDPLAELGVSKQQSDQVTGFLSNISTRVKGLFKTGADQAVKIVDENATAAQAKTKEALLKLANQISTSSEAQQLVKDTSGLAEVTPSLMQQIAQSAGKVLEKNLQLSPEAAERGRPLPDIFRQLEPKDVNRIYNLVTPTKPVNKPA
jgi:hypothetical protein